MTSSRTPHLLTTPTRSAADLTGVAPIEHTDALVARVADGDQLAFAQLYERLAPFIWEVVVRVLPDATWAEEIARDSFIDIWRHAGQFEPGNGSVRSWATATAHRRAVERLRSDNAGTGHTRRAAVAAPLQTMRRPIP